MCAFLVVGNHGSSGAQAGGRRAYLDGGPSSRASLRCDQGSHLDPVACYPSRVLVVLASPVVVPWEASEKLAGHADWIDLAVGLVLWSKWTLVLTDSASENSEMLTCSPPESRGESWEMNCERFGAMSVVVG